MLLWMSSPLTDEETGSESFRTRLKVPHKEYSQDPNPQSRILE